MKIWGVWCFGLLLASCVARPAITPLSPTSINHTVPSSSTLPDSGEINEVFTPISYPWTDELATLGGICFEAALDAAGRVFTLRSAEDHIRFYDLADNSALCRHPVQRLPFDFNGGRVLVGLWSYGTGCKARHDVLDYVITPETVVIELRFVTIGDCPYELLRPFWIGLPDAAEKDINIAVVETRAELPPPSPVPATE